MAEPREGYWMVRLRRDGPEVPARLFWCDHEPGIPENKLDRWPMPYLQGQIGTDLADPYEIWAMLEFVEATPAEQRRMANPPPADRAPRSGRQQALQTAPMAKWRQERARRITEADWRYEIADLEHAQKWRPEEPKVRPKERIRLDQLPIPF
jgi:hypothetical protein